MKSHLLSLLAPTNRWRTLSLFITAILLITASQVVGTTDNLPGIAMLFGGIVLLFFSFLHPWRDTKKYAILAGISVGIIVLVFLGISVLSALNMQKYISDGVVMIIIFLFSLPGIVVSFIGILICARKHK